MNDLEKTQEQLQQDRVSTIGTLDRQAKRSSDEHEKQVLTEAAQILRKRNEALTRGPSDTGGPLDEMKTR